MVEDGLVRKVPRPDVAMAQHVLTSPPAGQVATAAGSMLSAGGSIRITVHGKGCHGSVPHLGVYPVVAGHDPVTGELMTASQAGLLTLG